MTVFHDGIGVLISPYEKYGLFFSKDATKVNDDQLNEFREALKAANIYTDDSKLVSYDCSSVAAFEL